MVTDEVLDYVRGELRKGTPRETIRATLLQNGWAIGDVAEMFSIVAPNLPIPGATTYSAPQASAPAQPAKVPSETPRVISMPTSLPTVPAQPPQGITPVSMPQPLIRVESVRTRGKGRIFGIICLVLIVLVLAGAGGLYAYAYTQAPQIIASGLSAAAVSSYHADIDLTGLQAGSASSHFMAKVSGDFQGNDLANGRISAHIAAEAGSPSFSFSSDADVRYLDQILYLRINSLSSSLPTNVTGKWFNLNYGDLLQSAGVKTPTAAQQANTGEQAGALFSSGVFVFSAPIPMVDGNGPAMQYTATVDKAKLAAYLTTLYGQEASASGDLPLPTQSQISEQLQQVTFSPMTVRIMLPSRAIDHFSWSITVTPTQTTGLLSGGTLSGQPITILLNFDRSAIGAPVTVEAPATSTPLMQALTSAFTPVPTPAPVVKKTPPAKH